MKKIYLILFLMAFGNLHSQIPKINWTYDTKDNSFGQSASADLDGDGYLEIVFSNYRNDGYIYCLNAEDGSLLWKKDIGGCGDVAPLIVDADDDGNLEVILPGSCNPKTFCFNGKTGEIKWAANTRGSDSPPTMADLDGDGKQEILHGEFTGYLIDLDAKTGERNWEIQVDDSCWVQTAPTICNINNDGYPDFVVATWSFRKKNIIVGYSGKDHSVLWKNVEAKNYFYHGTAVADLNNDGIQELVLGCYDGNLYVLNAQNGIITWKYSFNNFYTASPAVIADLDKDGKYEIIFSNYYYITALRNDGKLYWTYEIKDYGQCFRGVALSDIDGDNYLDVVFGDSYGVLYTLKGQTGDTIWTMDLAKQYGDTIDIDHAPLIADFNKDGKTDIYIYGGFASYPNVKDNYGRAYCITAGIGKGPQWLMFQLNKERNSFLSNDYLAIEEEKDISESISPNPASDYITVMQPSEGSKPSEGLKIEIYNIFGEKNPTLSLPIGEGTGKVLPTGEDLGGVFKIDVSNLAPGVYFIKIGDKFEKFVKM
jgi:outer membrane protein assembly factor BamB